MSNYTVKSIYIHNKMLEETDSVEDEMILYKEKLCPCTNQELKWVKNNTIAQKLEKDQDNHEMWELSPAMALTEIPERKIFLVVLTIGKKTLPLLSESAE